MLDNLRILQANLNHDQIATESALQLAVELSIDLMVVQEPWIVAPGKDDFTDCRSVNHSSFSQLLPQHVPTNLKPRVMFYVSRFLDAQINPITDTDQDPDMQIVKVQTNNLNFTIYNIYNEGDRQGSSKRTIERALLPLSLTEPTLVLGDFNLHHHWWDPLCTDNSAKSEDFISWVHTQRLELLNDPGIGTYFRPKMKKESVLDLSFATEDLVPIVEDWQVLPMAGSDHHPILFTLSALCQSRDKGQEQTARYNTRKADWDSFSQSFSEIVANDSEFHSLHQYPHPSPALSKSLLIGDEPSLEQRLDSLASRLTNAITQAASTSIPRIKTGPRSKPWWNDQLKDLRRDLHRKQRCYVKEAARCSPADCFLWKRDFLNARNLYFQKIKAAKRDHWNQFLEKEDPQSIFKAMSYTRNTTSQRIPPIQSGSGLQDSFDGKCSAFRQTLFPTPPQTDLPDWERYNPRINSWEWPPLSRIEVHEACSSKVKSKTPGPDNITQDMVIAAYQAEEDLLFRIFSLFFDYGYHPRCWKQATGVILKKAGKPDYSAPKAYRVISLLNCLGKVLERMLAKRLGALAEVTHLLHPSQMGGRSRKSAIDTGLLLLDEVQRQRRRGRLTSTVFLDIKGAFDHVALNQLLRVMSKLNLPYSLISWTRSFLTQRLLRLSFDGQSQEFTPIESGIPQGSPISPILFLIYIRDLFQISTNFSLSYMDDLSISTSSTSLMKNARTLNREIDALFKKGEEMAIQFDPAKTELIHFTTSKKAPPATITLPDQTIVKPKKLVKWLGIDFDNALSFKEHIATRISRATSAFHRMCRLANKERGLTPFAMRQLYMACVVSVADFGAPIFWKGQEIAKTRYQSLQNIALHRILGTFRTSPIIPSEVEAALPPPEIRMNTNMRRYAFRARKLPPSHPIQQALHSVWTRVDEDVDSDVSEDSTRTDVDGPVIQMERIALSIQDCLSQPEELIIHDYFRPWQRLTPFETVISPLSKEEEAQAHSEYMTTRLGSNLLAIYSDASSVPKGKGIGVGLTARDYLQQGDEVHHDITNLGKGQIVYNGELEGIAMAFEYAADVATAGQEIRIHADNQAAIHRLKAPSDMPGQSWQLRCFNAARTITLKNATVSLHWVPGHEDIEGNERADQLAKAAAMMPPTSTLTSLALTGIKIKDLTHKEWMKTLHEHKDTAVKKNPNTYAANFRWRIRKRLAVPVGTKRLTASTFYQLKLGHGYLKAYLARIRKSDSSHCSCGAIQTANHLLLSCKWYRQERRQLKETLKERHLTLPLLLHTKKGIAATLTFLESTKVATRKWQLGHEEEEEEE